MSVYSKATQNRVLRTTLCHSIEIIDQNRVLSTTFCHYLTKLAWTVYILPLYGQHSVHNKQNFSLNLFQSHPLHIPSHKKGTNIHKNEISRKTYKKKNLTCSSIWNSQMIMINYSVHIRLCIHVNDSFSNLCHLDFHSFDDFFRVCLFLIACWSSIYEQKTF